MDYLSDLLYFFKKESPSLERFGNFVVNSVVMLTGVDACMLRIVSSDGKQLLPLSSFGIKDVRGEKPAMLEGSIVQKAFQNGTPTKILDIMEEPLYQSKQLARKNELSSMLLIPLSFHNRLIGSLNMYIKHHNRLDVLENDFIELYAVAIETVLGAFC